VSAQETTNKSAPGAPGAGLSRQCTAPRAAPRRLAQRHGALRSATAARARRCARASDTLETRAPHKQRGRRCPTARSARAARRARPRRCAAGAPRAPAPGPSAAAAIKARRRIRPPRLGDGYTHRGLSWEVLERGALARVHLLIVPCAPCAQGARQVLVPITDVPCHAGGESPISDRSIYPTPLSPRPGGVPQATVPPSRRGSCPRVIKPRPEPLEGVGLHKEGLLGPLPHNMSPTARPGCPRWGRNETSKCFFSFDSPRGRKRDRRPALRSQYAQG
jgi:hypothetical protein